MGNIILSALAKQRKDLLGFHLSKFGVVLLPVFIQKLFSNLSRKHREGSLRSVFKSIHISHNPQLGKSAQADSSSVAHWHCSHPADLLPILHHSSGRQTPEWNRIALTRDSYSSEEREPKSDATDRSKYTADFKTQIRAHHSTQLLWEIKYISPDFVGPQNWKKEKGPRCNSSRGQRE